MFSTSDVEALSHLDYISEIAKYFKSDTTHISTIWMNSDTLSVIISRRRKDEYIKYKVFEVEFMRDNFAFKRAINSEDVFFAF